MTSLDADEGTRVRRGTSEQHTHDSANNTLGKPIGRQVPEAAHGAKTIKMDQKTEIRHRVGSNSGGMMGHPRRWGHMPRKTARIGVGEEIAKRCEREKPNECAGNDTRNCPWRGGTHGRRAGHDAPTWTVRRNRVGGWGKDVA